jgi:Holliday junction resolvase RusA-like endonuclease
VKTVAFTVEGRPVPLARPRFTARLRGRKAYTPGGSREYEARVAWAARKALGRTAWDKRQTYSVIVDADFVKGGRVDLDNVVKGVLDALTGTLWEDDAQVWHVTATKNVYAKTPGLHVLVMHFEAGDDADKVRRILERYRRRV